MGVLYYSYSCNFSLSLKLFWNRKLKEQKKRLLTSFNTHLAQKIHTAKHQKQDPLQPRTSPRDSDQHTGLEEPQGKCPEAGPISVPGVCEGKCEGWSCPLVQSSNAGNF